MDYRHQTITLFSSQADPVLHAIEKDGVCYSKAAYVRRKYGESSPIFLTAYDWYVRHAEALVPKPEHAEFPYWAFTDTYNVDTSAGGNILTLEVPIEEVVFFQVKDWNKILCLTLIGESEAEEDEFRQELSARGLHTTDIMLTSSPCVIGVRTLSGVETKNPEQLEPSLPFPRRNASGRSGTDS